MRQRQTLCRCSRSNICSFALLSVRKRDPAEHKKIRQMKSGRGKGRDLSGKDGRERGKQGRELLVSCKGINRE